MPITKAAYALLENPVVKPFADPLNVGVTLQGLASGDTSLGEAVTGTAVGVPAFHYAQKGVHAGLANLAHKATSKNSRLLQAIGRSISPRMQNIPGQVAKMVPGRIGSVLGMIGGMGAAMVAVPPAMKAAKKYFPLWKRKAPTGQPA